MPAAPNASPWIRLPAVAGHFYPSSPAEVDEELAAYADEAAAAGDRRQAYLGAVCPHAGWRYAGALAYRTLARCVLPERVVILAVNHRHRSPPPWSIWPEGLWRTPLGDVPVDAELAAALMKAVPELVASAAPHAQDHATEVLLPMLQKLAGGGQPGSGGALGGLKIVPIVPFLPVASEASAVDVGARIGAVLKRWHAPVFVLASNDMTHFAPAERAREQDQKAIAR
ncbi:MAG TPA: AmmeMemoRadiSam system protein B, partial [Planctomycetota bacterium]|nr:AmmeMemoRadiSam system protein B [Planctomycetota bacterium]